MEAKGDNKQFKVLMLCFPAHGHMNPFMCYAKELAKNPNVKIIMYSSREFQKMIEGGNIEYRNFEISQIFKLSVDELRRGRTKYKMIKMFMDCLGGILPELVRCVTEEGIDLVVYDFVTVYAKWLMRHLKAKYKRGELKKPPPKGVMFAASILSHKDIYPNSFEDTLYPKTIFRIDKFMETIVFYAKYAFFCYKYHLQMDDPLTLITGTREDLNMVCIVPEFHPRSHLYPSSYHFVGNCASEEFRGEKTFTEPLKSFIEPFPEINPLPLVDLRVPDSLINTEHKLIYISLGTVVNTEVWPFLRLIDAVKAVNLALPESAKYKFLMSTGDLSYAKIQFLVNNNKLKIPDNLLIMPKVPQLDVLKRASLFVTHSGQGSTSESIHYGVPMVCIPVMGDQPSVAYRTADELGLGVRLDFDNLQPHLIKDAILKVLNDKTYLERVVLYSQISRKYQGTKEATRLTIEYLQSCAKC